MSNCYKCIEKIRLCRSWINFSIRQTKLEVICTPALEGVWVKLSDSILDFYSQETRKQEMKKMYVTFNQAAS